MTKKGTLQMTSAKRLYPKDHPLPKVTKPQAGFDQDVTKFEERADAPTQDNNAREAPEAEPPQEDGWLPTVY
eukprot:7391700-Pyramimonas_sp.AAC.1